MGLKIFINGINLHTRCIPMAVSSGLKGSQRVSKCLEPLGAEHIRESHAVPRCQETFGAERSRTSHSNLHDFPGYDPEGPPKGFRCESSFWRTRHAEA